MNEHHEQVEEGSSTRTARLKPHSPRRNRKVAPSGEWRYDDHLGASMALAFGSGLLLGMFVGSRTSETLEVQSAHRSEALGTRILRPLAAMDRDGRLGQRVSETWDLILDGLVGVATVKAMDMVESVVPGFRDQVAGAPQRSRAGSANR